MHKKKLHSIKRLDRMDTIQELDTYEKGLMNFCLDQWANENKPNNRVMAFIITHDVHKTAFLIGLN